MAAIFAFGTAIFAQVAVMLLITAIENRAPASDQPLSGRLANFAMGALLLAAGIVGSVLLGPLTTLAVNAVGGGYFVLPSKGLGLMAGAVIHIFAMDFGEYLFHRAQHAIPFMWAMHSLHHSDSNMGTTTTIRHFWFEPVIKTLTIWLAVGLLFKASPVMAGVYGFVSYYNFLIHANLRLNFRWSSWLLNAPAYHRIHHSALPQHFNCNYAALFPVFDVLSGAYRRPGENEYPATGLDTGAKPRTVLQAVAWPVRHLLEWKNAAAEPSPRAL